MQSVLVVSYYFPPTGGAGVQRPVKFVKYLSQFGWTPVVLTVSNPSVPAFDQSLLADLDSNLEVIRTKTLEPSYQTKSSVSASNTGNKSAFLAPVKSLVRKVANILLQPDPQVLWLPTALKAGIRRARKNDIKVIFVSAPPFSSLVLAALISKYSGKPLVVDYRDEWDISNEVWENKMGGGFNRYLQQKMQNFVLRQASRVVATTVLSEQALAGKIVNIKSTATTHCIYNGFDNGDLANLEATPRDNLSHKAMLTYVGTLWNLTSIVPVVQALNLLASKDPALLREVELCLVGRKTAEQIEAINQLDKSGIKLTLLDYVDHSEALRFMKNSDLLLLLLSDMPVAARVMPGKTFEYLATGNAILAIGPKGEVWKVLANQPGATCIEPSQIETIANSLKTLIESKQKNAQPTVFNRDISRFDRVNLTQELSAVLTSASQQIS